MNCSNCNHPNPFGSKYCNHCGQQLLTNHVQTSFTEEVFTPNTGYVPRNDSLQQRPASSEKNRLPEKRQNAYDLMSSEESSSGEISGNVANVKQWTEQDYDLRGNPLLKVALSFDIITRNANGNLMSRVPVQMRGYSLNGSIYNDQQVKVYAPEWKPGKLVQTSKVIDLSTGATISMSISNSMVTLRNALAIAGVLLAIVVFLGFILPGWQRMDERQAEFEETRQRVKATIEAGSQLSEQRREEFEQLWQESLQKSEQHRQQFEEMRQEFEEREEEVGEEIERGHQENERRRQEAEEWQQDLLQNFFQQQGSMGAP